LSVGVFTDSKERSMKIKLIASACVLMLAFGFSLTAGAGSITDGDGDLIPDVFDNCVFDANGPNDAQNQTDGDNDGFGDACDCDYTSPAPGDGLVLGNDLLELFSFFNQVDPLPAIHDNTGDGLVLGDDLLYCFSQFNSAVGGS